MKKRIEQFFNLMGVIGGAGIGSTIMAFGWVITKNSLFGDWFETK